MQAATTGRDKGWLLQVGLPGLKHSKWVQKITVVHRKCVRPKVCTNTYMQRMWSEEAYTSEGKKQANVRTNWRVMNVVRQPNSICTFPVQTCVCLHQHNPCHLCDRSSSSSEWSVLYIVQGYMDGTGTWNTIRVLIVTTTIHCYKSGRRKYYMGVAETVYSTHTCHVAIIAVLSMQAVQSLLISKGDRTIGCSSTLLSPL